MRIDFSLRRLAILLVVVMTLLTAAGAVAEYMRFYHDASTDLANYFSLTEEKNFPTWWSSFLLLACSLVLWAIATTKRPRAGEFRMHWIVLSAIFCYISIDEFVEIHEWLSMVPGLGHLHGFIYYGWVIPAGILVAIFAVSYLRFLFHLPMNTRWKVAVAGVCYVGGAAGIELILGWWTDVHGEKNFTWAMIGEFEEVMEIVGSSLFLYTLVEYLGRIAPDLGVAIRPEGDERENTPMSDAPSAMPAWLRSPWVKWSWLLLLVVIVAQSLDYHWRKLPTSATGYFARGRADYLNGEFDSAIGNFTKSLEQDPNDVDTRIYRGEAYAKLHDFGNALPDIEKALALKPDYEKARAASGDVKAAAWDDEGAVLEFARALAKDPSYARCYLYRGQLLYELGRWDEAMRDLRQAQTMLLGESQVSAHLFLWMTRARSGDVAGATEELRSVMKPGLTRGDRFWMAARFLTGEVNEPTYLAAANAAKSDAQDEDSGEAYFLAGSKRLVSGDRSDGTVRLLQHAVDTFPIESLTRNRTRYELETLILGFHPMRVDEARRKALSLGPDAGLAIVSVVPGSPAAAAGIKPGAVLTAIDDSEVDQESFVDFLSSAEAGSTVQLHFAGEAGSAAVTIPLTIGGGDLPAGK